MTKTEIVERFLSVNNDIKTNLKTCNKFSVSKFLDCLKQPFDQEAVAYKCFVNAQNNPEKYPKYVGMSVDEILESWNNKSNTSKQYGMLLDNYIGYKIDNRKKPEIKPDDERGINLTKGFDAFIDKFSQIPGIEFVAREMPVYLKVDDNTYVSGRFDALFHYTTNNTLVIIDWKNTENIKTENRWESMRGPMYNYDDCDLNHYSMQLNLYIKSFKDTYNIIDNYNNIAAYIVQIRGQEVFDNNEYYMVHKPSIIYNDKLVTDCLNYAKSEIFKK